MSGDAAMREFRRAALEQVNAKRQLHAAPALTSSAELDKSAQRWAETLASKASLENSAEAMAGEYGESVSQRTSAALRNVDISAEDVISQWYNEMGNYNFKEGTGKAGNFTQMVWQTSRQVGFGKAQVNGKVVSVAHYRPPGNYRGRYAQNVNPPLDSAEAESAQVQLVGELAGFRITQREVLRDEEVEDGRPVVIERERIQLEDEHGNVKERVVERRQDKQKASEKPAAAANKGAAADQAVESRPGSIVHVKDKELSKFAKEVLSQHNRHRGRHGVKSLKLNSDLTALAQSFAEELSGKSKLYNSNATYKGDRLGENIASRWSNGPTDYDGEEVVDHWYSESDKYRFHEEPTDVKGIGNFSQMVWKGTKELGVGKAVHKGTDGSHKAVVVCFYHPSGNVLSAFRENVMPTTK